MKRKILLGLAAAIGFQFLTLIGMYLSAQMPLWTGEAIRLEAMPVDPRSLFRGNYARLEYEISHLDIALFPAGKRLREGEVIYVALTADRRGIYRFAGVSLKKPQQGRFLRGRIAGSGFRGAISSYRVRYGIEAYFAPKEKALGLETDLRKGGIAEVMVSKSGRARLKHVSANPAK
ncbi:GDYXXLXY domain-containing protein [Microbulbifer thermotolerans]|uniref:Membrane-anchored protein n=1 Tax=Microbulbifer thermotolerans TaxID=252514 RepID=A0A143HLY6_MICTH|nr:GDYXXLXY domain-containing protein [Microbulbifer thermotolerans]AMX02708.1 hypothetical protein A3224_09045 [Microbulbifer thermotolerans]MCX2780351.1 GDYXXLXY domain-containing protein [Microbulbifer thermotolerans]MCX2782526.1 GDYXXLXY domain-containing protein [Microbulbifer thermotolerans]MCX2794538.1 GDYXXLXY domain-containing protein [Microbulbifer thermotolerans]MCX2805977.1 GDYXXLXY domain-containing protein [Microbulbifer thermotolerans]